MDVSQAKEKQLQKWWITSRVANERSYSSVRTDTFKSAKIFAKSITEYSRLYSIKPSVKILRRSIVDNSSLSFKAFSTAVLIRDVILYLVVPPVHERSQNDLP